MKWLKRIGWLAVVIGVPLIVTSLIVVLWAYDVWQDRKHTIVVKSETPAFAGSGDSACGGMPIKALQPGTTFRAQRIRYWKNCATLDIVLPDGKKGYVVFDSGVSVSPPLD